MSNMKEKLRIYYRDSLLNITNIGIIRLILFKKLIIIIYTGYNDLRTNKPPRYKLSLFVYYPLIAVWSIWGIIYKLIRTRNILFKMYVAVKIVRISIDKSNLYKQIKRINYKLVNFK